MNKDTYRPSSVHNRDFGRIIREVNDYDELTIGDATEHGKVLQKMVEFGGGCLKVVFDGLRDYHQPVAATQEETLF